MGVQVSVRDQGPGGDDAERDFVRVRHGHHRGAGSRTAGHLHAPAVKRGTRCLLTTWCNIMQFIVHFPLYVMAHYFVSF